MARFEAHTIKQVTVKKYFLEDTGSWVIRFTLTEQDDTEHEVVLFSSIKPDFPADEMTLPFFFGRPEPEGDDAGD